MPKSIRHRPLVQASLTAALALLATPAFAQSLSLLDARVVEGNAGDALLVFEARLSAPASGAVRFDFATSDGSAAEGSDYRLVSVGGLSIPAGQTRMLVSVPVNGDLAIEANEYLNATLANVSGASVARAAAKGLIVNDDNKMLMSAPVDPGAQTGSTGYATEITSTSGDGRLVAFVAVAQDLVAGRPANSVKNVYVRDSRTGVTTLASVAADGGDANGDSNNPVLSANGRYLVFQSAATNIVANDFNMAIDIFRRDLLTGATTLVSFGAAGTAPASGFSSKPSISADGRYVAFQSTAADLVAANIDTNGAADAFRRDMQTGITTLVSRDPLGTQSDPQGAWDPQISGDGRFVVYDRGAMVPWRRDMQTDTFVRAVTGVDGQSPNSSCYTNAISADGRYVVVTSWASNLIPNGNNSAQIYVSDVATGTVVDASLMADGSQPFSAYNPAISADGRYVAFQSSSSPVGDLSDGNGKVYLRDLQANTTIKVSNNWLGTADSGGFSESPSISADGRVLSFLSQSPIMLPGDDNGREDVFRVELPADPSLPQLSIADAMIAEGDSGTRQLVFTASLSAPATSTVGFLFSTADGSAIYGTDYSQFSQGAYIPAGQSSATFSVDILGDTAVEMTEAFNVYLSGVSGARVVDGAATGVIFNDDVPPPPSLSIGDVSISEGNSGTKLATFTVSLSAPAASAVSFNIATADLSALAGSDYVADAQALWIPAGMTSKTYSVVINGDGVVESDETFLVQVSNVTGATVVDSSGVGTIVNDDAYPLLSIGDVSISEGNSGTQQATFTVTLSAPASSPVSYDIATADGSALAGSDYVGRSLTGQFIPAGMSSAIFTVAVNGDTAVEANENFQVNVGNVVGAIVADGQAVGTIVNDDVLPSLSIADVSISEGNSGTKLATFTVQLSAAASAPVSYSIATANGTAVAPGDYTAKSLSGQTIPAGASSGSFSVSINGDLAIEPNESFQVNVSNVSGATVADGSAIGTISNDDSIPSLSIADVSISEGNNSSKLVTFTVTLSSAATGPVSFNIATANGTAVAPGDYTAKSATAQTIPAGSLSKTFDVSIRGDKTIEPSETFFINLSNVSGATVADGQAQGTIVNDDGAALTLSRVSTGGLYDDVDDGRGDPSVSPREYAMLLLDSAQQVCARAGGASIVGIDGVENLAVLADLADTANRLCPRAPHYSAALKTGGMGFLVDGVATKANPHGLQVLELTGTSMTVLADGHARPLTALLATTPAEINRMVRERLSADPHARLVVLDAEMFWVSPAVQEEFASVRLEMPAAKPAQQVLHLQP